jgi:hypothetical protein
MPELTPELDSTGGENQKKNKISSTKNQTEPLN